MSKKSRKWCSTGEYNALRLALFVRDGKFCKICDMEMFFGKAAANSDWGASIDHIQRRDEGGSNKLKNLRLIHRVCNNFLDEIHKGR